MPRDPRFVVWCDACGWNLDPGGKDPAGGRLEALERALSTRYGQQLYAELSAGGDTRPPRRSAVSLAAFALACLVHALTVALLVAGLLLIVLGWETGIQPAVGAVLVVLAVALRPRPGRLGEDALLLPREQAPHLYGLLDRVADEHGTRRVDVVVVSEEFNACVFEYGYRRRRCLTIGLALWTVLTPQQRVALLGHEFGHYVNGDPRSGLVIGTALDSLHHWVYFLTPHRPVGPIETAAAALMYVPRTLAVAMTVLLVRLTGRASQRAEYHADDLAARTGSSEAAAALFDRLALDDTVESSLRRQSALAATRRAGVDAKAIEERLWTQIAQDVAAVPARERERLRRVGEARGHAEDCTHPPSHLRARRMREGEQLPARITLDTPAAEAIDAELAPAARRLAHTVVRELAHQ
ncbi:M48 family metalloprotease [Streptomyces smaragdinus]|nr:M48 family metallopeptidase [Streptomyces smaragdinus]